jgi:surface antigen
MRTFRSARAAFLPPVAVIGAALLLAGAAWGEPARTAAPETARPGADSGPASFAELRSRLDRSDRIAALRALQMALNRVADGGTFRWKSHDRELRGLIRPTNVFRNTAGQLCRHVVYRIALGDYRKQIEFVACREAGGRWRL